MGLSIKKGDTVRVIAGKDRGKSGRVLSVNPEKHRITVEKVNMIKKHMKPSRQHAQGGIIDKEASVNISNVMLVCPKCNQKSRIGNHMMEGGKKLRICKKCKEVID